ncbi:MAG: glutamine--fructose-6-phosphate transaminase (isomerizing) [Candidatus Aenigmarchaeota archaeon ex4484_14]|nr:MAG: glutamine--fructose-6-phosphate transaminase (isomerizing) [Candidatus Aenigmarchaeota archaeon ex4484_14]
MCGIVGIVSEKPFEVGELIKALKRLEYRGYDSVGFATDKGVVEKDVGEIKDFMTRVDLKQTAKVAISHTRWATHGGVTRTNAHPHTDCSGDIMIVHNGIIENFAELKNELKKEGHKIISDTDSELIAHFFEGKDIKKACVDFFKKVRGTFAVLIIKKGGEEIYALKKDSPLALGIADGMNIIGSDIYAFSDKTNKAIFFDDNEFAIIGPRSYEFFDKEGNPIEKHVQEFEWSSREEEKKKYKHFMIKEIKEQPIVAERLVRSLETEQKEKMLELKNMIENAKRIIFVAAGTSYHASLLGTYFLHESGVEAHALIASEFNSFATVDDETLIIAISQSGETMDVIKSIKFAKERGAKIASIVNVPYSSIQRLSDISLNILAGQEICVASTKTFTNQVILLLYLCSLLGYKTNFRELVTNMQNIFEQEEKIKELAKELKDKKDIYVIGRAMAYPVAREIALKLKEISYIHAEGMMGGELKHGTIALIEDGVPVISLIPEGDEDIISNTKEVEARGARTIIISSQPMKKTDFAIPSGNGGTFAILSNMIGQMLTYYIALEKGLPIDKPRNLAKSVTVK